MVIVTYIGHSWGCHPETCACREYAVVTKDGRLISKHYHKDDADEAAKIINSIKGGNMSKYENKDLRELLYTAVDALIVRESICNDVRDFHPTEKEEAVEDILDILMDLFV